MSTSKKAQHMRPRTRVGAEHTKGALRHFCRARATETLVTWFGVHVTKVHVYGATSGGLSLSYWNHGEPVFGALVLAMAAMDLLSDVRKS